MTASRGKTKQWHQPTINDSPLPDKWGVVDRIIAGFGIASFLGLLVGCASHFV